MSCLGVAWLGLPLDGLGCLGVRRLGWSGHTKIIFIFEKIKQIKINYISSNQNIFSNQRAPLNENFFWMFNNINISPALLLSSAKSYVSILLQQKR